MAIDLGGFGTTSARYQYGMGKNPLNNKAGTLAHLGQTCQQALTQDATRGSLVLDKTNDKYTTGEKGFASVLGWLVAGLYNLLFGKDQPKVAPKDPSASDKVPVEAAASPDIAPGAQAGGTLTIAPNTSVEATI